LKKKGRVRAVGASTKTAEGGRKALELLDVAMAAYTPDYTDEKPVLDYAAKAGKGVLLKKILASGHLSSLSSRAKPRDDSKVRNPVQEAMDFAFSHSGVRAALVGTINP
jgi:aryl-alcohol dehydrogenase-like predicted oxidoreductase